MENLKEFVKNAIAKNNGVNLLSHNRNVSITAKYIANFLLDNPDPKFLKIIELSGLLHDIGKILEEFQELLHTNKKTGNKFLHNEIGWAFIVKYFHNKDILIANSIHWHHGINNKLNSHYCEEIIESISEDNIQLMKECIIQLLDESYLAKENIIKNIKTPNYYYVEGDCEEYNKKLSIIRTCLISADRMVSNLENSNKDLIINDENIDSIIYNIINKKINKDVLYQIGDSLIQNQEEFNLERFNRQLNIAKSTNQTTIINAPTGFGKTLTGIMWSSLNDRKTIWVCPRNVIVESLYDSIEHELRKLKLKHVTIELYLTGNTVKKNHNSIENFSSDIIITNIDSFEAPSIKDNIAERLFLTHSANIIFDEYHEFLSDSPYFSCFINLMRIRNQSTTSKTLLLSATPIEIYYMWDTIGKQTLVLPNKNSHYPAIHNRKYLIQTTNNLNHKPEKSEVIIFNSIYESQIQKSKIENSILYHSEFTDSSKKEKYDLMMKNYGKYAPKTLDKEIVIGTMIIQASLDVSFSGLSESILSPESTIQRIGRCDRFEIGYDIEPKIKIFKLSKSRSESAVIEMHYSKKLMELWYDDISKYNNQKLSLNELYLIYNKHIKANELERKKLFNMKYRNSLEKLGQIYPKKMVDNKNDIIIAGSNKLRSTGNEIFFLVKRYDSNEYAGPFTTSIHKNIGEDFHESGNILNRILKSFDLIQKQKYSEFDYSEILKNKKRINIDMIRNYGRKKNTPYIRYDKVYHMIYGLIENERLNKLLNIN